MRRNARHEQKEKEEKAAFHRRNNNKSEMGLIFPPPRYNGEKEGNV